MADVLQPLFTRLSEPDLLESGIDGFTQNANESLHHLLWEFCPKTAFTGSNVVAIAAGLAVLQFNTGSISLSKVLNEMGIPSGYHCTSALHRLDYDRIIHANIKSQDSTKLERKRRRAQKKGFLDAQEEREGAQYSSGRFLSNTLLSDEVPGPSCDTSRKCSKCRGPMKGHKRGQPCPDSLQLS